MNDLRRRAKDTLEYWNNPPDVALMPDDIEHLTDIVTGLLVELERCEAPKRYDYLECHKFEEMREAAKQGWRLFEHYPMNGLWIMERSIEP